MMRLFLSAHLVLAVGVLVLVYGPLSALLAPGYVELMGVLS